MRVMEMFTSMNFRMTSILVVVCRVGATVRNRQLLPPAAAMAIGTSSCVGQVRANRHACGQVLPGLRRRVEDIEPNLDFELDQFAGLLGDERLATLDRFDRVQLVDVVAVCSQSRSLSEAGRILFAASRQKKQNPNDADRLRKHLLRFGLSWHRACSFWPSRLHSDHVASAPAGLGRRVIRGQGRHALSCPSLWHGQQNIPCRHPRQGLLHRSAGGGSIR